MLLQLLVQRVVWLELVELVEPQVHLEILLRAPGLPPEQVVRVVLEVLRILAESLVITPVLLKMLL
jgi:hypothetical protein